MAKQTFSVGQVLTAAQMTSLQQTAMLGGSATAKTASYTLVAADAGTVVSVNSTSATTITVNTGLFSAGDTVTIQNWGSGAVTITAGTATVNTAGSLIVPQYDGGVLYFTSASAAIYFDFVQAGATSPLTTKGDIWGYGTSDARIPIGTNGDVLTADSTQTLGLKWASPSGSGLTLIAAPTSFSAVTSQSLNNVFTSTYLNYKVLVTLTGTSASSGISLRFRASGSDDTTSNYNGALVRYRSGSASITDYSQFVDATSVTIGESGFTASPNSAFIEFTCNSPQASQNTYLNGQASNMDDGFVNFAMHKTTTSFDGFTLICSGGNNMTGNIAVYGLAK